MGLLLLRAGLPAVVAVAALASCSSGVDETAARSRRGHVEVPRVVGLQRQAAVPRLHRAGLRVRVGYAESLRPVGTVVAQRPAPGVNVRSGTRVVIAVSRGPGP